MIRSILTLGFTLALATAASAQIAPPPGAATHQGSGTTPKTTMGKTHMSSAKTTTKMTKPKTKATPKPKS